MSTSDSSTVAVSYDHDASFDFAEKLGYNYSQPDEYTEKHSSPYVSSQILSLDVGCPATRFLVHSEMLDKSSLSSPFTSFTINDKPIVLPELDEATAHTLIHYLYSSKYQAPSLNFADQSAEQYSSYKQATCVYCASLRYRVTGLEQLAKQKMSDSAVGLSIFSVLAVARDHAFTLLPESDTQYSDYLETCITEAMKVDPEPFMRPEFITKFGCNSRLLQVIWKTVMSKYAATPAPVSSEQPLESGAETPLAESMLTESEAPTQSSQHQLPSPTESVVDSPPASRAAEDLIEPQPLELDRSSPAKLEMQAQASPDDTEFNAQSDATFNDDFGLPAIEPMTEESDTLTTVNLPPTKLRKPEHVRADSVMGPDATVRDPGFDDAKREGFGEAGPTVGNGNDTTKRNKRKNKKKSSIVF